MAGIYIHIPFCKQACHYCDFHFSTNISQKSNLVNAIVKEIKLQKEYLSGEIVETIYFGGGTPSLLTTQELDSILQEIYKNFLVSDHPEITLEANPDDISGEKISSFKALNINRLSIGIQTFHTPFLSWMNRAHNAEDAQKALDLCFGNDFNNLTIDLIYGIPHENHSIWENDLQTILKYPIKHVSAYNLTIEPQTAFGKWKKSGKLTEAPDSFSAEQMQILVQRLENEGFEHYEISNFAKQSHYSKHNTAYWQGKKYLGIGPSAHAFNQISRQHNISNNKAYISALQKDQLPFEIEILSEKDKANEMIMTGLRAIWGVNISRLKEFRSLDFTAFSKALSVWETKNMVFTENQVVKLTKAGKFFADAIASDLFFD